jgi:DtxR family Mn-dependent transcriptional regulator
MTHGTETADELSASLQDYLEAIYHIARKKGAARVKDIAERLDVSSPSVTGALRALSKKGLVNYAPYDVVSLTEEGTEAAEAVVLRHETLHEFFVDVLKVDEEMAEEAACRMEHALPQELVDRFVEFTRFMDNCPYCGPRWDAETGYSCEERGAVSGEKSCVG